MGLRPGRCYRSKRKAVKGDGARGHRKKLKQKRAYTRAAIKVPRKNYIGATPALRIRQFNMGNPKRKYNLLANLIVKEGFDLRDNAIESSRMAINRHLVKVLGKDGFFMKVRAYPGNILRENKTAQGAGADRVSQGMSMSFGKPVGRAARVRKGQVIFSVLCKKGQETTVKESLMRAKARFPSDVKVLFTQDVKSIGTLPTKKIRDEVEETKTEEAKEGTEAKATDANAEGKDAKTAEKPDAKATEKTAAPEKKK